VHRHGPVIEPQRGEHRAVGAEHPVRGDVRQPGAVDRVKELLPEVTSTISVLWLPCWLSVPRR
jgi:hypothetical protein